MNIGFIGTGNMGGALIEGLSKNNTYSVSIYDIDPAKASRFNNVKSYDSIESIASACDALVLTVKPSVYDSVLKILSQIHYKKMLISVAAGITTSYILSKIPSAVVIRTMPNTPALVGEGMTLIAASSNKEAILAAQNIFSSVGKTVVLPENLMEAGTALSGSSPAIVYHMIDVMANNALSYGIPKELAISIAAQVLYGSAKMVLSSSEHPASLTDKVCSPGGTTIAAMKTLAQKGFEDAIHSAMDACVEKTFKMKK